MPAQPGMAPGMMPGAMPGVPAPQAAPAEAAPAAKPKPKPKPKPKALSKTVNIKLLSFKKATKIKVVKEVRVVTKLGLRDSKELVEKAPSMIKKGVLRKDAEDIKAKFAKVGGEVVLE